MSLSHEHKRFIKKNIREKTVSQISQELNLSEREINAYLKDKWGEEKYQKFTLSNKTENQHTKISTGQFSLKELLKKNWPIFIFLIVIILICYVNSLGNALVSDDIPGMQQLAHVSFGSILNGSNLEFISSYKYVLLYKLFGPLPAAYRMMNAIFHMGSTILVYLLAYITIKVEKRNIFAFIVATLFAVHPILLESITWITGGAYAQYTFFLFLSLLFYILSDKKPGYYIASLITAFLCIGSISKGIVLPFVFFAYDFSMDRLKTHWKKLIPFFAIDSIFLFFHLSQIGNRLNVLQTNYAEAPGTDNPLMQVPIAIVSYLTLIVWPDLLTLYHSELSFSIFQFATMIFVILTFVGLMGFFYWKKKRELFFWLSLFIISLLPTLTPLRIASVVAERYVYMGTAGILVIFGYYFYLCTQNKKTEVIAYGIFVLIVLALMGRTIVRNSDWTNEDTLWLSGIRTSPTSSNNHNNLGDYYARHNNLQKAAYEFQLAAVLNPRYSDAIHNLANTNVRMGNITQAVELYKRAISIGPRWQSHQNLASIYFEQKQYQLAQENIVLAIKMNPQNPELYANLGVIYLTVKDNKNASQAFQKALQLDPRNTKIAELFKKAQAQ